MILFIASYYNYGADDILECLEIDEILQYIDYDDIVDWVAANMDASDFVHKIVWYRGHGIHDRKQDHFTSSHRIVQQVPCPKGKHHSDA